MKSENIRLIISVADHKKSALQTVTYGMVRLTKSETRDILARREADDTSYA